MIEFTMSRVAVCACGIAALMTVVGFMDGVQDGNETMADETAVKDIARMLDEVQRSGMDTVVLEGSEILPSSGHSLTVTDGVVRLYHGDRTFMALTSFGKDFELGHGDTLTIAMSVPEGLGDLPDGVGEDVDLLETVVQVDGGAGASVDSP